MYEPKNLKLWTMPDSYFGAVWPATYVFLSQHRDSDALARSNFTAALERIGGESETVEIVRESHWAVGWVEWIAIHQDDETALRLADEVLDDLADYPVLDEEAWSELEWNEASDFWNSLPPREKVQMAMYERDRRHWLSKEPVWHYGRMDYSELANAGTTIAEYLTESLRH